MLLLSVQGERAEPFMMKVSEKCAQRRTHYFRRLRTPVPGVAFDVAHDVGLANFAEVVGAGGAHLTQKPMDLWQMFNDCSGCQAALSLQIVAKPCEYLVLRSDRRQRLRFNLASIAQHRQPPLQR